MAFLEAVGRRFGRVGNDSRVGTDEYGNVVVSDAMPKYARLAAAGNIFAIDTSGGTSVVPDASVPTTTVAFLLYNYSSTKTMVLLRAATTSESGTLGLGLGLAIASTVGVQTLVTADYSGVIKTCTNGSDDKPEVYVDNEATIINTPAWNLFAARSQLAAVEVGAGAVADTQGMFVAPPGGYGIAFQGIGPLGSTAKFDYHWLVAMLELDR